MTGLDYRGVEVLAAHEPISILDLGLVGKMDISEIRKPFVKTGLIALGMTILVIFIASRLFFRVSRPIEHIIDQQAETFRTLAETAREGIILASTNGTIEFVNPAAEQTFWLQARRADWCFTQMPDAEEKRAGRTTAICSATCKPACQGLSAAVGNSSPGARTVHAFQSTCRSVTSGPVRYACSPGSSWT